MSEHPAGHQNLLFHLEPSGFVYGGEGTPLGETWVDLSAGSRTFYGLNGAGKTRLLEGLAGALTGIAAGGRILARVPYDDERMTNALAWALGKMLAGDEGALTDDDGSSLFEMFEQLLKADFGRRSLQHALGEFNVWGEYAPLSWDELLESMARTPWWLFTPTGSVSDTGSWRANPVVLVDEVAGDWQEHLTALHDLYRDEFAPLPQHVGLEPLWWGEPPSGAPIGIVGTLLERSTAPVIEDGEDDWPFGSVVTDREGDPAISTRRHLFANRPYSGGFDQNGSFARTPIRFGQELVARAETIAKDANTLLAALLADAPALRLNLGNEEEWFLGVSCQWSATRLHDDETMPLHALSFAERRWAGVAIGLSLAARSIQAPDPVEELARTAQHLDTIPDHQPRSGPTWLLLDEPERGLHRTAEAQMARGLGNLAKRGVRVLAATHSPELLDQGLGEVNFVRRRSAEKPGEVLPLAQHDPIRDSLGLNPSDLLRRTRGFALVEGEHDHEVLRGMIGPELDVLGIEILAVRGSTRLKTVIDSQFLYEFTDAVLFTILDGVGLVDLTLLWERHVDRARTAPVSRVVASLVAELKAQFCESGKYLAEFLAPSLKRGTFDRVAPLGIPQSDVLECLPVASFVTGAATWAELRAAGAANHGGTKLNETEFKKYLCSRGADLSEEHIGQVARATVHPDIKALATAMAERLSIQQVSLFGRTNGEM